MTAQRFASFNDLLAQCPIEVTDNFNTIPVTELIAWIATVQPSSYTANADGSVTLSPGNGGAPTTVPANSFVTFTQNGDGSVTFTPAGGGTPVTIGGTTVDQDNGYSDANNDGLYTFNGAGTGGDIDTRANSNPYAPGNAGAWPVVPNNVASALDTLIEMPNATSNVTATDEATAFASLPGAPDQGDVHNWIHPDGPECGFASWVYIDGVWVQTGYYNDFQPNGDFRAPATVVSAQQTTFAPVTIDIATTSNYNEGFNVLSPSEIQVLKAGLYNIDGRISVTNTTPGDTHISTYLFLDGVGAGTLMNASYNDNMTNSLLGQDLRVSRVIRIDKDQVLTYAYIHDGTGGSVGANQPVAMRVLQLQITRIGDYLPGV